MFKNIHINKGPNVTNSVACMIAIFFIGSMLLFSTFLSQGVFADSMSERMKIREELSGVSSDDQNIMSASAEKMIHQMEIVHVAHVILDRLGRVDRLDQQVQRDLKARKAILVHKGLLERLSDHGYT